MNHSSERIEASSRERRRLAGSRATPAKDLSPNPQLQGEQPMVGEALAGETPALPGRPTKGRDKYQNFLDSDRSCNPDLNRLTVSFNIAAGLVSE